ncbi:hypothetical protein LB505_001957 [Fusarium chuoi]|nr:hypothetical protein LB505_001957 [Fusarium chuoi]
MDRKTSHLPTWQDNKTASEKDGFAGHDEKSALLNDNTKNQQTMDVQQIFNNRLMPVAFALPWHRRSLYLHIPPPLSARNRTQPQHNDSQREILPRVVLVLIYQSVYYRNNGRFDGERHFMRSGR